MIDRCCVPDDMPCYEAAQPSCMLFMVDANCISGCFWGQEDSGMAQTFELSHRPFVCAVYCSRPVDALH